MSVCACVCVCGWVGGWVGVCAGEVGVEVRRMVWRVGVPEMVGEGGGVIYAYKHIYMYICINIYTNT